MVANADAYLIAPASANTIAKLAAGIADSMVTTSFLPAAPRLVAPAMNDRMYRDPATQANLATLRERGVTVIEPEEGALASRGEHGVGRLPEPGSLLEAIERACRDRAARGMAFDSSCRPGDPRADRSGSVHRQSLVRSDGPGRWPSAARRGAEVTLVAANVPCWRRREEASTSRPPPSSPRRSTGSSHPPMC